MITVTPPQVVPYGPASQQVSTVRLNIWTEPNLGIVRINVALFDTKGRPVAVDRSQLRGLTKAEEATFLAFQGSNKDSLQVTWQKAALPYLEAAYGLKGTVG